MEKNNPIQRLSKIRKVEAPPFLFTRIEQKINDLKVEKAPFRLVFALVTSFCVLLFLNIYLLNNSYHSNNQGDQAMQTFMEDMNMDYSNQLYYE